MKGVWVVLVDGNYVMQGSFNDCVNGAKSLVDDAEEESVSEIVISKAVQE